MAWNRKYNSTGMQYGGVLNSFYWDWSWFGSSVTFDIALANCTVYARGRQFENGRPSPITSMPNARLWHTVVNTSAGWELLTYTPGMTFQAGDIIESISYNHVAVCETGGTSPVISGSYYTTDNGTAYGSRTPGVIGGSTLQDVSNWMLANYPDRFFHTNTIDREFGGYRPDYVLRYPEPTPPEPGDPSMDISPTYVTLTMNREQTYVEVTYTVHMYNVPVGEGAGGGNVTEGLVETYSSGWQYSSYDVPRTATKIQTLRYNREGRGTYDITLHNIYNKRFSTGSVYADSPLYIHVDKSGGGVIFLNPEIGSVEIR